MVRLSFASFGHDQLAVSMARILGLTRKYCAFSVFSSQKREIMTSSFCAEKALEELKVNPYFDKYASKITSAKREDPEKLLSRLAKLHEEKSSASMARDTYKSEKMSSSPAPAPAPSVSNCAKTSLVKKPDANLTKPKLLSTIMKIECVADKSTEEIKMIWEEYHKHKDVIAAIIPCEINEMMFETSKQFPTFLFPLPRDHGYEFILCQFSGFEVHFTSLANYQVHKENAPECLTLVHFTELKEKGIVLMRGEYNTDIINAKEALCLTNQLQLYYCQADDKRRKLMERFTFRPTEFQHMDLVAELECLTTSFYLK